MAPKFWPKAQEYERKYTAELLAGKQDSFAAVGELDPSFFEGKEGHTLRTSIMKASRGGVCLEVGSSVQPAITCFTEARELRIVEPMAKHFPEQFAHLPKTARVYPVGGEEVLPQWAGQCDVIYTRNCIDHAQDPLELFDMILACAAPGCWLLHWSDVWHYPNADEGHRDITPNPKIIRDFVAVRDWDIKYQFSIRFPDFQFCMDYGCVAVKKTPEKKK